LASDRPNRFRGIAAIETKYLELAMRIDAHQHFWVYDAGEYAWIGPDRQPLMQDHLPSDLEPLLSSIGFDGSVAVQARSTVEETEWLLSLAEQFSLIKGIVGWVDMGSQLGDQLEQFSKHPRFVGIRHGLQTIANTPSKPSPTLVRGMNVLGEFDLAFDLLVRPQHLALACELVSCYPRQRFVLDHIAKPPIKSGRLSPWDRDIRHLAAWPNVSCKLSGMVSEADQERWQPEDMAPYLDMVMSAFGPERTMIGSDWPVCTAAGNYAQVMDVTLTYIERFSTAEQDGICGGNAQRIYQIEE
jgi:L-fuconolactonase